MCNAEFANLPLDDCRWLLLFASEAQGAREKHPTFSEGYVEGAAVVAEEAGELVREALKVKQEEGQYYRMHQEAIRVGATALRFCIEGAPELPFPAEPRTIRKTTSHVR